MNYYRRTIKKNSNILEKKTKNHSTKNNIKSTNVLVSKPFLNNKEINSSEGVIQKKKNPILEISDDEDDSFIKKNKSPRLISRVSWFKTFIEEEKNGEVYKLLAKKTHYTSKWSRLH